MELSDATFKDAVRTYVEIYDELAKVAKQVKELRKKGTELSKAILHFMQKNRIDEFQVGDGKLCRRKTKRIEGLKKDHIIESLKAALGSEEKVDAILTQMNSQRNVVEGEALRRTRQGKTTAE